jgi:tRNA (uracil-5-)-methyltransferase TRM9
MKLYRELANKFSNSRAYPWKGWEKVSKLIKAEFNEPISMLDLGCGNGRFLDFLLSEKIDVENYLGIDNSPELLKIADNRFNQEYVDFLHADLEHDWISDIRTHQDSLGNKELKYDFISIFGVMHHIETHAKRVELLLNAKSLLKPNGVIFVTYWQFGKYERFLNKAESLGSNDYNLPFNDIEAARFCHFTDEKEAVTLEKESGVHLTESFYSDGSDSQLNLYRFYK